jgi:predicted nucleic-acid-binding Zn-ribbon protein
MISCNKCKCSYHPDSAHLSILQVKHIIFTKKYWKCLKCEHDEMLKKFNELKMTRPIRTLIEIQKYTIIYIIYNNTIIIYQPPAHW